MTIRNEEEKDYRTVEELTKKAFWNVNVPGCNEHYVAHALRTHPDFIPQLDLVAEEDGKIIGNIMYTKCRLLADDGTEKEILTFGPLSVHPDYQRRGIGKQLQQASFRKAEELGYDTVVIFGNPENYVTTGFKNGKRYNVGLGGVYPVALLVKELKEGALAGKTWTYAESAAYEIDEAEAGRFDADFEPMEKTYRPSQELFSIYSRSVVAY